MRSERPQIVIVGGYGFDDLGDDLILRAALTEIRLVLRDPQIVILSNNPYETRKRHAGVEVIFSPEALARQLILRFLWPFVPSFRRFRLPIPGDTFRRLISYFRRCDAVLSLGGGYINDYSTFLTHSRLVELIVLGLLRSPLVMLAHELGPLRRTSLRFLLRIALKLVTYTTVRDESSYRLILALAGSPSKSLLTAEQAWCYTPQQSRESPPSARLPAKLTVAVNLMSYQVASRAIPRNDRRSFDLKAANSNVIATVAECLSSPKIKVGQVFFLAMSSADYPMAVALSRRLPSDIDFRILRDLDSQLIALAHSHVMIAMRLHAVIMAARMNVPPVAIVLLPKVAKVMQDLGLLEYSESAWPLDKEQFSQKFKLLAEKRRAERASLIAAMKRSVDDLSRKARLNTQILGALVGARAGS